MALGRGAHVVLDADGLFEETLHAAEVDTAIDKVLHGTETGGGPSQRQQSRPVDTRTGPVVCPAAGGFHGPPQGLTVCFEFRFPYGPEHWMARYNFCLMAARPFNALKEL